MNKLTHSQLLEYKMHIIELSILWAKNVKNITDPTRLKDYEAGLYQGMTELVNMLKLHNYLNLENNNKE